MFFLGYIWKGCELKAFEAKPAPDPMVVKRRLEQNDSNRSVQIKKIKTVEESSTPLGKFPYEEQLKMKQSKIEDALKKFSNEMWKAGSYQMKKQIEEIRKTSNGIPCELQNVIPSPAVDGYRNKCEFSIGKNSDGEITVGNRLGSYAGGLVEVASVQNLKIVPDKMKLATKLFQDFVIKSNLLPYNVETSEGYYRQFTV